jgi:hypothetical protein
MTAQLPPYSLAASKAAQDALDAGDEALNVARAVAEPAPRRSTGVGSVISGDAVPTDVPAQPRPGPRDPQATHASSRHAYEYAQHHYLNAASLYHTGVSRGPEETPAQTIARLPGSSGQAVRLAYQDYLRETARPGLRDLDSELERMDRYLTMLREELIARVPQAFEEGTARSGETSPMR